MLRKVEQNIFPHEWSQVHAIIGDQHLLFSLQRQVNCPVGQRQRLALAGQMAGQKQQLDKMLGMLKGQIPAPDAPPER